MSKELHHSQLIHRLRVPSFKGKGFESCTNFTRPGASPDIDWNWQLENIKPINFFIGPNNSGKSRLLRLLLISDLGVVDSDTLSVWDIIDRLNDSDLNSHLDPNCLAHRYDKALATSIRQKIYQNRSTSASLMNVRPMFADVINEAYLERRRQNASSQLTNSFTESILNTFDSKIVKTLLDYNSKSFCKTYIPLLRGLRTLSTDDVYLQRTLQDYFNNKGFKPNNGANNGDVLNIFTGHTLYEDLKKALLGNHQQRKSVKDYENFLSEFFFDNEDIALVPRIIVDEQTNQENNVVHIKIGDRKERAIYDLGDGLQTIIMLTVQAFLTDEPTMFFIEEPEQNVHAGLQRSIIEAFRLRPQHMFFMTTHSNHFIDLAQEYDDVGLQQIHQRVKGDNETTVVESSEAKMVLLDSLGVRASSVLTANCSIWVEGVTDKLYLGVYLEKFLTNLENSSSEKDKARAEKLRHYKENLHYVFTEYQGSNITHWDFSDSADSTGSSTPAKRLNNKIFLLADGDISGKKERVEELTEKLGNNFYMLKWKEIENFIPFEVLVKTAETRWKTFKGRKGLKFNSQNIIKNNKSDFFEEPDKGIGLLLEPYVRNENDNSRTGIKKHFFKEDSGTIKDKLKFCHAAVNIMQDKEFAWELTPELNDLCEAIWTHIEESN
ncbi:AAA family ATPase [Vibrio fluvialis]|nr:AAA family ATPase [Vibrio fluvialis]